MPSRSLEQAFRLSLQQEVHQVDFSKFTKKIMILHLQESIWWRTKIDSIWNVMWFRVEWREKRININHWICRLCQCRNRLFLSPFISFSFPFSLSVHLLFTGCVVIFHLYRFDISRKASRIARNSIISYLIWVCLTSNHFTCMLFNPLPVTQLK